MARLEGQEFIQALEERRRVLEQELRVAIAQHLANFRADTGVEVMSVRFELVPAYGGARVQGMRWYEPSDIAVELDIGRPR